MLDNARNEKPRDPIKQWCSVLLLEIESTEFSNPALKCFKYRTLKVEAGLNNPAINHLKLSVTKYS